MRRKISIMMVMTASKLLSKDNQLDLSLLTYIIITIEATLRSKRTWGSLCSLSLVLSLIARFHFLLCLIPMSAPSFSHWKQPPNHYKILLPYFWLYWENFTKAKSSCQFRPPETSHIALFLSVNFLAFFQNGFRNFASVGTNSFKFHL
ncbi:Uncharacterized protein TCM_037064 [Theobroma cacao]|uniref:Uncharacterized protein n=1 Tax=Theobroma cacao TaxID=3641 RepID=A0A061GI60_THECC|nr:Uncharacterized protein TCM_037064 [Theobroma cacao]